MTEIAHDLKQAIRLLRRQPRYTLLASLMMALGIGATTVLFSVTWGLLMKPLAWTGADRLVVLRETRGGNPPRFGAFSNATWLAWRKQAKTVDGIAAWSPRTVTLTDAGDPERLRVAAVSASLFQLLRARPLIGSLFTGQDEVTAGERAIVLSEGLWRQRFGADLAAPGRLLTLDGQPHRVGRSVVSHFGRLRPGAVRLRVV